MTIDRRVMLATMASLAAGFGPFANAQPKAWPTRTVKFIVGAAAGGSASDAVTRFFANQIAERSKQPVVVDNRPGADGNLAAEVVARSAPDGHTFLVTGNNTHAANVHLYKSLSFDPEKDFAPVTTYARVPYVLLINGNRLAARTLKDFITHARANPGKLTYASAAVASRVGVEQLKLTAKFEAVNVAYKSGAQAMTDLLGGHVDFYIADAVNALQQVHAGRAIALGVTVAERLPAAPDLPTIAESGFPDFDFASWLAVWTSAGTPPELVRAASAAINDAMGSPAGKQFLEKQGLLPYPGSPEALRTLQQRETLRWGQAIKAAQMVAN